MNLVRKHGEAGAAQAGFTECLNAMSQGKVAMWYDATSAAGSLEDPSTSKAAGKIGYVYAPVEKTKSSGWLWAWAWAMPKTTKKADAASKFMLWASSKKYEKLVGEKLGWARVPAGKRASTYGIPQYEKAAASFGDITLKSIQQADPTNPGVQPRPTVASSSSPSPSSRTSGPRPRRRSPPPSPARPASTQHSMTARSRPRTSPRTTPSEPIAPVAPARRPERPSQSPPLKRRKKVTS